MARWLLLIDPRGKLHIRVLLVSLVIIAALITAHLGAALAGSARSAQTQDGTIALFDLDDELTVSVWYSSFLFILVAFTSMALAWSRAHQASWKQRGWRGVSLVALFFSLDETSGIHETGGGTLARIFPQVPLSPSSWWALPYALLVGMMFLFIAVETRWRPKPLVPLVAAGACWCGAVLFEYLLLFPRHIDVALEEGLELLGTALLLYTLLTLLIAQKTSDT
ncbi:MAG: hypothetical protein HN341_07960 [Verrucomicrobia bacterium]|nr:hypothetical protein [Verrucomicrobiota bacterium]